jgi:glutaredoxin 1|tara:strand:- start:593 stop:871 length:279 start_codon:yes stop_codon:yes gene_type:complete
MVVIYGKDTCGWCDKAVEVCEQQSIPYEYKSVDDVSTGPAYLLELKQLAAEQGLVFKTVPQIWWNSQYIGGFDKFAEAIEATNIGNYGQGDF